MLNSTAFPTQESSSTSRGIRCWHKRGNDDRVTEVCFITNGGNAISEHACPEIKDKNPTAGLTLLWLRNPFRGNSNYTRIPLIRTMVIRISNYPDRLVPSGKFVENST
jgi:hypothetical protein